MSAVTVQEIISGLRSDSKILCDQLAGRIKQHGIAPPDVDANGCSTHPKAQHGFARQASHSSDEYVCECAGFDPYEAGYQAGLSAAWDADGALLPDGMVLVPEVATEQIIEAIIERGNQHGDDISYDTAVLIWNDAIYAAAPSSVPPSAPEEMEYEMNDELIKRETLIRRINEWTDEILPDDLLELLQDCRAALSSQSNSVVKESLTTEPQKYVPMTDDERDKVVSSWINTSNQSPTNGLVRIAEAEVIRRAGLVVSND